MQVLRSDSAELAPEFGILAGRWTQYSGLGDVPFGAMWCVVPPGGRSHTDCHPERELVVVVQGVASVHASGEEMAKAGSAVLLDGGEEHVLVNPSEQEPLVFLSIYWLPDGADGEAQRVPGETAGG
ncbi:MAG TPA: cupin domain-containing protein [Streptosporangiaceae bacterium]|nr:cupin domain-containing protein [Streptosporangiaceae bacterium]